MKRVLGIAALCALVPLMPGCGTVVNGMHQDLAITSNPGGAAVSVDGISAGSTPVVMPVSRKHAHVVKIEQPGFYPFEASVVPVTSTWEWGNIIFAGIVGLAVDAWTGGMYDLSRDTIDAYFPAHPNKSDKVAAASPAPIPSK